VATPSPIPKFSALLAQLDAGTVDDVLSAELATLVQAVQDHDKAGALTLKVTVEPAGSGGRTVAVVVDHKASVPRPRPGGSVLWVGDQGALHRADPYQQTLTNIPEDQK
jgi:hypothetical protein